MGQNMIVDFLSQLICRRRNCLWFNAHWKTQQNWTASSV